MNCIYFPLATPLCCHIVFCSHDKVLMSRQQRYAVSEPPGNKPCDAPPPGGENDQPHDDTKAVATDDKPSD